MTVSSKFSNALDFEKLKKLKGQFVHSTAQNLSSVLGKLKSEVDHLANQNNANPNTNAKNLNEVYSTLEEIVGTQKILVKQLAMLEKQLQTFIHISGKEANNKKDPLSPEIDPDAS